MADFGHFPLLTWGGGQVRAERPTGGRANVPVPPPLVPPLAHVNWLKEVAYHCFLISHAPSHSFNPPGGGTDLERGYRMCGPEDPLFPPLP